MMPNSGSKKKDNLSRMDRHKEDLPKLSNEMQLSIMNKVKNGELSIEDALDQARRQLLNQRSLGQEEQKPSQCNFSVHKHGRYRWQKRVLQIDFKTKTLCSIEKGIIKRRLPFSIVKSCDDGVGSRFSISFKEHHDYELEATSVEDKHKMMQLVNQIIYGNIYSDSEEGSADAHQQPRASQSLREGVLLLHRGGLASFRWVKYEVQLHPGQLTLVPFRCRDPADGEATSAVPVSIVIHLSDGDTRVEKPQCPDAFTLVTHKNEYQFKVPVADQTSARGAAQRERDAWVNAIDRLCSDWKRRSRGDHAFQESAIPRNASIAEDAEVTNTDLESGGGFSGGNTRPPVADANADPASTAGDGLAAGCSKPVPVPRSGKAGAAAAQAAGPTSPSVVPRTPPLPQPSHIPLTSSSTVPESVTNESGTSAVKGPSPPSIPSPPPLPFKLKTSSKEARTKAFHWDLVGPEKIGKSFWTQGSAGRIEIDTSRLYEQFAVKDLGRFDAAEHSNTQHIMLNQKIAQNFNIFLKSFPVQPGELKDKLFIVSEEDGGLSDEHITSLRRYIPTADDVEMYKSHKGPAAELHIVDQYMMEMCNIPHLSAQLDLLLILRELPISMSDLQPLSQLRGRDRKLTLLHALVEQIALQEPHLATFTQDLAEFETVPGASIKGLTAEVDVLKNELQKVIQFRKTPKKRNAGAHHPNFSKDLKTAIDKYKTDLAALTKTCEEMKKLYSVILVKFGEPADQDSQELLGLICQFVHDFKRAHAEMI
ncbi:formin-like protein 6 isoform X2 [Scophthalmus maximus]|uniref:formin-like protein 6 isoform X2 n=1 Tax=Scophthalmus maximus TaxID=52904 RepID=UPI0015E0FD05|nr:formin-like protein 6 isoform X2 [Scophthalmus maximus]